MAAVTNNTDSCQVNNSAQANNSTTKSTGLLALAAALSSIAGTLSEVSSTVAANAAQVGTITADAEGASLVVAQAQQQQAEDNYQQQIEDDKKKGFFGKIASHSKMIAEVAGVALVAAVAPELAAPLAVALILSQFAAKPLAEGISMGLQAAGVNANVANMIGAAISTVIITAVTVATGAAAASLLSEGAAVAEMAGEEALTTGADEAGSEGGIEMTEIAAEGASEGAGGISTMSEMTTQRVEQTVTDQTEQQIEKGFKDQVKELLNPFNKSMTLNQAMLGASQAWSQSGGTDDALALSGTDGTKAKIIANGITQGLTLLMTVGSAAGMMSMATSSSAFFSQASGLINFLRVMTGVALVGTVAGQIGSGIESGKIAGLTEQNGEIQANLQNLQYIMDQFSQTNESSLKATGETIQQDLSAIQGMYNEFAGMMSASAQATHA